MKRKDYFLLLGVILIATPAVIMLAVGGPFNATQWLGLGIILLLGFGFLVAGTPDPRNTVEDDVDAGSMP